MATRPLHPPDAWRALAWAGLLLLAALLVVNWQARQAALVFAMATFLAAGLALLLRVRLLPGHLTCLLVMAMLVNAAGGTFGWLDRVSWYDEFAHAYTGFAGLAAIGYLYTRERPRSLGFMIAWCAGMGLLLGAGWEVIEGWIGDLEFVDTASDLVLDVVGAALGGALAWAQTGRSHRRDDCRRIA